MGGATAPPTASDFLFRDPEGAALRETSSLDFLGGPVHGRLRHGAHGAHAGRLQLASLVRAGGEARVASEARDRLSGHRPKDTKSLLSEDDGEALRLLAEEVAKIPVPLNVEVVRPLRRRRDGPRRCEGRA